MDEKDLLIAQLRKENAALQQMIEDLQKQVKNLTEAVLLLGDVNNPVVDPLTALWSDL